MRKFVFLWAVLMVLALQVGPLTHARADVVGRLTQVEGRVDLLKGGQLPATPVKLDDGIQPGDVLRTKSLSKAQITFVDNSTLNISPESRVAIETYMFDAAKQKRSAVLQLFQGLAHVVVSKVSEIVEPDFVIKTHTAIMGVRGTEFGIRLQPNSSTILNLEGALQVGNVFPEVGQLSPRAFKVAFSFGPGPEGSHHWVLLHKLQGTTVAQGLPPTLAFNFSMEDWKGFLLQMASGLNVCRRSDGISGATCQTGGGAGGAGPASGTLGGYGGTVPTPNTALGLQGPSNPVVTTVYTPPPLTTQQTVAPPPPPPPPPPPKPPAHSGMR